MIPRIVVLLLVTSVVVQAVLLYAPPSSHKTLPIFTPVSLEMERAMRKGPAPDVEASVRLAQALADAPDLDPALAEDLRRIKEDRLKLLDLRNQRHALNTRLMEVGVRVGGELSAEQWDVITMRRDALRKDGDAAVFDRVLQRLSAP